MVLLVVCFVMTSVVCAADEVKNSNEAENEKLEFETNILAKVLFRECRGIPSETEQAAVAWVVLNRVDSEDYPDNVEDVVKQEHQFAWVEDTPVTDELYALAKDVLCRYKWEKLGFEDVGRVIPRDYYWFAGRDGRNTFRNRFRTSKRWDFSWETPYDS